MTPTLLAALLACTTSTQVVVPPDDTDVTPTGDTAHTGSVPIETGDTGPVHTGDTGPLPTYDCAMLPDQPLSPEVMLDAPRGYNDVVFDTTGAMVGSDGNSIVAATSAVDVTVFVPNVDTVYKMGVLPGGDIVAARAASGGGGVMRIAPDGSRTQLGGSLRAYGLAVGSDGQIYIATNYTAGVAALFRIDPDTGVPEQLLDLSASEPRDIAFSRDYTRLYWGTLNGGDVWAVDLDANLDPAGTPELVATVPQGWHDTVEVDACGNLYVGSVFESAIYRIRTDGSIQLLIDWSFNNYGHGLTWGDASGGWNDHAMYITHPYVGSLVSELDVGVPGAHWPGVVIGGDTL